MTVNVIFLIIKNFCCFVTKNKFDKILSIWFAFAENYAKMIYVGNWHLGEFYG